MDELRLPRTLRSEDFQPREEVPWVGHNPTWFWRDRQVYDVLCAITQHWSQALQRDPYLPPPALPCSAKAQIRETRESKRQERSAQVLSGAREHSHFVRLLSAPGALQGEATLYAAMIQRAFLDYTLGVVSPLAREHRNALNAYWWVMGLPLYLTDRVRKNPAEGLRCLLDNQTRFWKASPSDPWVGITPNLPDILDPRAPDRDYYPTPWKHLNAVARLTTFRYCSDRCGLEPVNARVWLHLMLPEG